MFRTLLSVFVLITLFNACGNSQNLKKEMVADAVSQADKDKNAILEYAIAHKLDVKATPSGMYYVITKEGDNSAKPDKSMQVTAHYHGTTLDGKVFDSSVDRGEPFKFNLGGVIKGWQEAIPMLGKGAKGTFLIPSELAYGARGAGADIPPNSPLVFEIELIDFADPAQAAAKQTAIDEQLIADYAKEHNLTLQKTKKGVYYVIEKEGTGTEHPTLASTLTVHYHGTLLDGTVFDSSVDRGESIDFPLARVIVGWQEGIPVLTKGGKAKFIIPSALAYGGRAAGKIPPNSVLVFDVELIDFK